MPFYISFFFLGGGSPTKIDYRKKGYPYSNLSTGGPKKCPGTIGVLFGCFGREIEGPGLPGGLVIYQGEKLDLPVVPFYLSFFFPNS